MQKVRLLGMALLVLVLVTAGVALAQDQVTINVWGHGSSTAEDEALNAAIAAFEEANPDINVELLISPEYDTQLQAAFASGDYPDAFYVGQSAVANFVKAGVLAAGDGIESPEGIYPALLSTFTVDGTLYCPAKDFSNLALEYNTDLFDAAGVDYPTADWTWDDLPTTCRRAAPSTMTKAIGSSPAKAPTTTRPCRRWTSTSTCTSMACRRPRPTSAGAGPASRSARARLP
jgi:multiple sugar transport system substrate-binding protein